MAISYKPFFKTLIDKDISREQIKQDLKISPATMAKLSKNENVSLSVIDKLCDYLNCEIEDIIKHEKNNDFKE